MISQRLIKITIYFSRLHSHAHDEKYRLTNLWWALKPYAEPTKKILIFVFSRFSNETVFA